MAGAARATLLALLFTFSLSADYLFNDHILSPRTSDMINRIGEELHGKTGINAYAFATNDMIGRGVSLYDYLKKYEGKVSKPYIVLVFAPNSKRIGLVSSSEEMKKLYRPGRVKDYAISIVSSADSNSQRSKYDLAMVQAYSELADEIAAARGVQLDRTIKNESKWLIKTVTWLVYIGAILVFWAYFGRPIFMRMKHGTKQ